MAVSAPAPFSRRSTASLQSAQRVPDCLADGIGPDSVHMAEICGHAQLEPAGFCGHHPFGPAGWWRCQNLCRHENSRLARHQIRRGLQCEYNTYRNGPSGVYLGCAVEMTAQVVPVVPTVAAVVYGRRPDRPAARAAVVAEGRWRRIAAWSW